MARDFEQGGSFAHRSGATLCAEGLGVVGKTFLVGLEALPVDIARVHVGDHEPPLGHIHIDLRYAAARVRPSARSTIGEGASIARTMQNLEMRACHGGTHINSPCAVPCALAQSPREQNTFIEEKFDGS